MAAFLIRRLASSAVLLFVVLSVAFFFTRLLPGDPLGRSHEMSKLTAEQTEVLRRAYGLDRPLPEQYASWMRGILFDWDWGPSFSFRQPAAQVLTEAVPNTLLLGITALILQYGLGLILGVFTAGRAGGGTDLGLRVGSLLLYSVPSFWLGLMAILLFHLHWGLLPAGGLQSVGAERLPAPERLLDMLRHLVLPAGVLGLTSAAALARYVRNSLLEVMSQDYIRTARSLGVPEPRLFWRHGLRNALVPIVQLFGLSLPGVLNGVLVVEVVFSWPGVGQTLFGACLARDYPLILAGTAYGAIMVLAGSLIADVLHRWIDPRLRAGATP